MEIVISGLVVGESGGVLWVVDVSGGLWYSPDFAFKSPDSELFWWQVSSSFILHRILKLENDFELFLSLHH